LLVDEQLSSDMALARRLVELGRSARASASVRTRQPLGRGLVSADGFGRLPAELVALVAEELNVRSLDALAGEGDDLVDHAVKPNFRSLGRRFGKSTPSVAAAIGAADPAWLAREIDSFRTASLDVDGVAVTLSPDDVLITQTPRSGWAVATEAGETVALEVTITPELRREGLAREVVRLVQDERKNAGLDVSDRIELWWETDDPELASALGEHGALIAGEVLAVRYVQGRPEAAGAAEAAEAPGATEAAGAAEASGVAGAGLREHSDGELGLTFWLRRAPAAG
jgi:isoleucyl-tRNA synthetase